MFGLGPTELALILLAALVLFGAKKLPELGKGLGEGLREFRRTGKELGGGEQPPQDTHGG